MGNIFTLFLYSPLLALSFITGARQVSKADWATASADLAVIEGGILRLLQTSDALHPSTQRFLEDEFASRLVVRFVFCQLALRLHSQFSAKKVCFSFTPQNQKN